MLVLPLHIHTLLNKLTFFLFSPSLHGKLWKMCKHTKTKKLPFFIKKRMKDGHFVFAIKDRQNHKKTRSRRSNSHKCPSRRRARGHTGKGKVKKSRGGGGRVRVKGLYEPLVKTNTFICFFLLLFLHLSLRCSGGSKWLVLLGSRFDIYMWGYLWHFGSEMGVLGLNK